MTAPAVPLGPAIHVRPATAADMPFVQRAMLAERMNPILLRRECFLVAEGVAAAGRVGTDTLRTWWSSGQGGGVRPAPPDCLCCQLFALGWQSLLIPESLFNAQSCGRPAKLTRRAQPLRCWVP